MAVEIRELVIRATIVDDKNTESPEASNAELTVQKEHIIQECVTQVLKIIKKSKNR
jgi:hypothetical protein